MIELSSFFYLKHQKEERTAQATHKTLIVSVIWQLRQKNNSLLGHRNKIFFPVGAVLTRGYIKDSLIC